MDDLYSGLELPKKTKRERAQEAEADDQVEKTKGDQARVKRQRVEKEPMDLTATVNKLQGYMIVDKKFAKASKLFCQLLSAQLTAETSELFMKTLTQLIDKKGEIWSGKKEFQTLVETLETKGDVLLSSGDEKWKKKLDTWKFLAITHTQLITDETYQFSKAVKVVKLRFEELVENKDELQQEERAKRLHSELMPLLRTIYSKLGVAWATTVVESVLALGTRHRLLFNEEDRKEVDSWTKAMRDRRSAPAVARSAGSDARPPKRIRPLRPLLSPVMFALRGGLTRAASAPSSVQQRLFASGPKKRITWRQKAKIEERKRNPPPPRQAQRQRGNRPNFLVSPPVEDGKKWRILSAAVLERLPVVQPDLKDWEMDFEVMQHEKALREDQRLEEDFWFMEPGTTHIMPEEAPWPNAKDDPEEIVGAGFHLAPRETEDDATNNRKSLNRALKGRMFLLVKNDQKDAKFQWFFPQGEKQEEEKMRDAALRQVTETVGAEVEVSPVGFAPIGYVKYLHDNDSEFDGTKVFFYKSQLVYGDVELNAGKASDYLWVTRDELAEYLDSEIADYVTKMVPP
ncbi:hypothetical protein BBJ29_008718 [Phytophthora kernoviae]|uniref:Nudix hydrolase domain-containing protein n=1 Tax=Phytophthora kernoviae TaxID=325452 RepID=A0A3F2RHU5_9STRA|nr:hypothetical protein BBP00_00007630 [Phytophthora kernoviae]RLN65720.1 hypothetical protein BBJ29_008718 [Phytophthora kernoviae]